MLPRPQKFVFAALCLLLLVVFNPSAGAQSFQEGVIRPGPAYHTLTVESAHRCQKMCIDDGHCRTWVFVGNTPAGNCQLKATSSVPQRNQCCYSGVVQE